MSDISLILACIDNLNVVLRIVQNFLCHGGDVEAQDKILHIHTGLAQTKLIEKCC